MSRRPRRRPGVRIAWAAIAAMLLTAGTVSASYKDDYMKGKNAAEAGNWAEAAESMRRAIQDEPEAKKRFKPYGTIFIPYVPHFYLGEALYNLGQCREALAAFAASELQGVVQGLPEYQRLQQYRSDCQQRAAPTAAPTSRPQPTSTPPPVVPTRGVDPARLNSAVERAEGEIGKAASAADAVEAMSRRPDYQDAWKSRADLARRLERASGTLRDARTKQQQGSSQQQIPDLEEAERLATQAGEEFAAILQSLETAKSQLARAEEQERERRRQNLIRQVEGLATPARAAINECDNLPQASQSQLYEKRRAVEIVLDAAADPSRLPLAQLEGLTEQLPVVTRDLEQAVRAAAQAADLPTPVIPTPSIPTPLPDEPVVLETPQSLRLGVAAFLEADYEKTASSLAKLEFEHPRAEAVGHLFRAAARYLIYVEGGREDSDLRDQATADVRAVRDLDATVMPFDDVFSPSFIDFFDGVK